MQRRASSGRRRIGSSDSFGATPDSNNQHHHQHHQQQQGTTSSNNSSNRRSRSQERSLTTDPNEEEYYSQESTEAGEDDDEEDEYQDALERHQPSTSYSSPSNSNGSPARVQNHIVGVVNQNEHVVITSPAVVATTTSASSTASPGGGYHYEYYKSSPSSPRIYKRSASDPFDLSGIEEDISEVDESSKEFLPPPPLFSLPTLPRYPVGETRDLNCWSEPSVDIFRIRGQDYLTDKKKVPSDPYLLRARGCDLFLFPKENSKREPVNMMERTSSLLNGTLNKEPSLVFNFRFPWGLMVLYYEIPDHLAKYLNHVPKDQMYPNKQQSTSPTTAMNGDDSSLLKPCLDKVSPGERALANWIMGSTEYKNHRLKLIPIVVEGPWVVRNLVTGKPAIIGTKLPVSYHCINHPKHGSILCAELDIGNSSATAKRIVSICRRYMNALTVDIGFVIQGNTEDELPEQMLGSIRIHGVDPLKAPTFV